MRPCLLPSETAAWPLERFHTLSEWLVHPFKRPSNLCCSSQCLSLLVCAHDFVRFRNCRLPPPPKPSLQLAAAAPPASMVFLTDSLRSRRKGRLRNVPLQMNTRNSPALAIFYFNMPPSLGSTLCKSNSNSSILSSEKLKKGVGGTRALAHSICNDDVYIWLLCSSLVVSFSCHVSHQFGT